MIDIVGLTNSLLKQGIQNNRVIASLVLQGADTPLMTITLFSLAVHFMQQWVMMKCNASFLSVTATPGMSTVRNCALFPNVGQGL